jgi:hypothetical protein
VVEGSRLIESARPATPFWTGSLDDGRKEKGTTLLFDGVAAPSARRPYAAGIRPAPIDQTNLGRLGVGARAGSDIAGDPTLLLLPLPLPRAWQAVGEHEHPMPGAAGIHPGGVSGDGAGGTAAGAAAMPARARKRAARRGRAGQGRGEREPGAPRVAPVVRDVPGWRAADLQVSERMDRGHACMAG